MHDSLAFWQTIYFSCPPFLMAFYYCKNRFAFSNDAIRHIINDGYISESDFRTFSWKSAQAYVIFANEYGRIFITTLSVFVRSVIIYYFFFVTMALFEVSGSFMIYVLPIVACVCLPYALHLVFGLNARFLLPSEFRDDIRASQFKALMIKKYNETSKEVPYNIFLDNDPTYSEYRKTDKADDVGQWSKHNRFFNSRDYVINQECMSMLNPNKYRLGKASISMGKLWLPIDNLPNNIMFFYPIPAYMSKFLRYIVFGYLISAVLSPVLLLTLSNKASMNLTNLEILRILNAATASLFGAIYYLPMLIQTFSISINIFGYIMLGASIWLYIISCFETNRTGKICGVCAIWCYLMASLLFLPNTEILWKSSITYSAINTVKGITEMHGVAGFIHFLIENTAADVIVFADKMLKLFLSNSLLAVTGFTVLLWTRFSINYTVNMAISDEANLIYEHRIRAPSFIPFLG